MTSPRMTTDEMADAFVAGITEFVERRLTRALEEMRAEMVAAVDFDGERTLRIGKAAVQLPIPIYRGVFDPERSYEHHDMVTHQGSLWHCQVGLTMQTPGDDTGAWRLAVKRGRDAR